MVVGLSSFLEVLGWGESVLKLIQVVGKNIVPS